MARKKKHPEHVNHERWLVSYADFITLLFAFFTTLYAISTVDAKKAGKLVFAMRAAFSLDMFMSEQPVLGMVPPKTVVPLIDDSINPDILTTPDDRDKPEPPKRTDGMGDEGQGRVPYGAIAEKLQEAIGSTVVGRHIKLKRELRGIVISLEEAGFFESGSVKLKKSSVPTLTRVGRLLRDLGTQIRIEGHSDDQGSEGANWDLSAQRALALVRLWTLEVDFPAQRLAAVGYGSFRPLVKEGSAEARARNRRVDVVVLSPEAAREEPPQ